MTDDFLTRIARILGAGYVVERELGAGMSRVVVARELALGRRVVVKVLPAEWGAGLSVERFRREVVLAAGLQHPHIVPLLAAAEAADGTLYYTMPYVEGESLRSRLKTGVPPLGESLRWLRDVASALAYAHTHGVAHRDMKPDNILLSDGYALVADFGIAKALRNASATLTGLSAAVEPITSLGMSLGTPAYMAPEQVAGESEVDHRTDIYALGIIAYELLTGGTPFKGSTQAILTAHLVTPPESLAVRRSGLPDGLVALVMRCLAKNAEDRPASAEEVVAALEAVMRSMSALQPAETAVVTGPAPQDATPILSRGTSSRTRRIAIWSTAALAAVAGTVTLIPRLGAKPVSMQRVVVATLRDASRDSSLDEISRSVSDGIADALRAVDGSDVVGRETIEESEATLSAGGSTPQSLAGELRAGLIVTGVVSAVGPDSVRVRVQLASGVDGRTISALDDVLAPRTDVQAATAIMNQRLAGAVAAASSADFSRGMLPAGNPPTLAALQAIREGWQLEASLRDPNPDEDEQIAELVRFDRAFKADTEYVQAQLWFASAALRRAGGEVMADSALTLVEGQQARLTPYERALMDALRADWGGNHEKSVGAWRRARTLAPAWPNRWWLAMKLRDANRPREALAIFDSLGRENAGFRRTVPALLHYIGDFAGESRALRRERENAPSTAQSLGFQGALLQSLSALDSVATVKTLLDNASQLPAESGSSLAYLLTRTSWELAAHGHAKEGAAALERAVSWCSRRTATDLVNPELAFDCMEAYGYAGRVDALAELAAPVLRARPDDADLTVLGLLGLTAALRGDRVLAEGTSARIARETRADGSHGLASWLRARISAALGDRARAVELLEDAFARGAGWSQRLDLHRDPAFAKLRGTQQFERLRLPQG